jgi:hypothetical protein
MVGIGVIVMLLSKQLQLIIEELEEITDHNAATGRFIRDEMGSPLDKAVEAIEKVRDAAIRAGT